MPRLFVAKIVHAMQRGKALRTSIRSVKGTPNKATFVKALVSANIAARAKAGEKKFAKEVLEKVRDGENVLCVDKCLTGHLLALRGQAVRVIAINDTTF